MDVKILDKKVVFDDFFTIEKWEYQYEKDNGDLTEPVERLCFTRRDSSCALVYNKDTDRVILVKQFRHCTYDKGPAWILELPAGWMEEGEEAETTIRRELVEEIGYKADSMELISFFYASPGCMSERMYVYYTEVTNVDKVAEGGGEEDENEFLEIVEFTPDELKAALANNELPDSKTIIGCNYFLQKKGLLG